MIILSGYIAAIDGGASKTDVVLCTVDGFVLNRIIGGPTNPNDIGFEKSAECLRNLLTKLLEAYGGLGTRLYSFYAGLSGGGSGNHQEKYSQAFKEMLVNTSNVFNGSDSINALNSGIGCGDGMSLIAGTGSVAFVRCNNKTSHVGGLGYLLDVAGSGYDIGRIGFTAALRAYDGRAESTILYDLYCQRLGGPIHKLIPEIYQKGKQYIASFAPLVFEAEAKGDKAAGQILDSSAEELALLVKAAARHLNEMDKYRVVLAGGLWKSGDALMKRFQANLGPGFVLIQPELPPVYGAFLEALARAENESCKYDAYSSDRKCIDNDAENILFENFKKTIMEPVSLY